MYLVSETVTLMGYVTDRRVISGYSRRNGLARRGTLCTEVNGSTETARSYEKAERYKIKHPSVQQTGLNI